MRVVMTLLVRDEADIIDSQIRFHLARGVDFFVVTDNGSTDGTTDILEAHAREGHLHVIREPRDVSQEASVTSIARLAATTYGADWVINSDADEFWWPLRGTLKDAFASVPKAVGKVRAPWRHFPPRPGDATFSERLVARLRIAQPPRWHSHVKTAHRADPSVVVGGGNHDAEVSGSALHEQPIEILHFPFRSREQFERKYVRWCSLLGNEPAPRFQEARAAYQRGQLGRLYDSYVVSDRTLRNGLREGVYALDTRLRDELRSSRGLASAEPRP
jgi:hypothetical protein